MWFGSYKVCLSPAFLNCSGSLNFWYIKVRSPFFFLYSLVAVIICSDFFFFFTIYLFQDSFVFLFLLWVHLQPVGKQPLQSAARRFLKEQLSSMWFPCLDQHSSLQCGVRGPVVAIAEVGGLWACSCWSRDPSLILKASNCLLRKNRSKSVLWSYIHGSWLSLKLWMEAYQEAVVKCLVEKWPR